jgi:branched-subunit amino acid transport protein
MSALDDGFGGYLLLLAIAVLVHEPWRWLGLILARNLTADSEIFVWVRAVATALVAGLVMRLILFPAGALDTVPLLWRLAALLGAIAMFFVTRRNLGVGVISGAALLMLATTLRGA